MELSDEELCRQVAKGDQAAFGSLVERHQEKAYRLAWSILKDADEARDLSQEAFIRVYEAASTFDERSRFTTWFYRIVVNLCLDHRRRQRGWRRLLWRSGPAAGEETAEISNVASEEPNPEELASASQRARRLWSKVDELSDSQRVALLLAVRDGFSSKEIAVVLQCSEATARVHLHRAVSRLKKSLTSE